MWTFPHVRDEIFERVPSLTHTNPGAAVVLVALRRGLVTALPYAHPDAVLLGIIPTGRVLVSMTAGLCSPCQQVVFQNATLLPTLARAQAAHSTTTHRSVDLSYSQPAEYSPHQLMPLLDFDDHG